jgi:hypothetical protein
MTPEQEPDAKRPIDDAMPVQTEPPPARSRDDLAAELAETERHAEQVRAALAHLPEHEYPMMVYRDDEARIVRSQAERQALGAGWRDTPPVS